MHEHGDQALVLACAGCCCGHDERGGPKTPPRVLKREMRRAFRTAGLEGRVRLPAALDGATELPPDMRARCFRWTGGGIGPVPPVDGS